MADDAMRARIEQALAPLQKEVASSTGLARWRAQRRLDRVRRRIERGVAAGGQVEWPPEAGRQG